MVYVSVASSVHESAGHFLLSASSCCANCCTSGSFGSTCVFFCSVARVNSGGADGSWVGGGLAAAAVPEGLAAAGAAALGGGGAGGALAAPGAAGAPDAGAGAWAAGAGLVVGAVVVGWALLPQAASSSVTAAAGRVRERRFTV